MSWRHSVSVPYDYAAAAATATWTGAESAIVTATATAGCRGSCCSGQSRSVLQAPWRAPVVP